MVPKLASSRLGWAAIALFAGCALIPLTSAAQSPSPSRAMSGRNRAPRYVAPNPVSFDSHPGWQSLFNGKDLEGWDGPPGVWTVESGLIVATSTAANPTGSTYLIWKGGEPADFEFKVEMKLVGQGANSGIQFRATRLGAVPGKKYSAWDTRGYQADFDTLNSNSGALIECCAGSRRGVPPRPFRAFRGQVVRTAPVLGQKPTLLATFGDPVTLKSDISGDGWNQVHLIARGNMMVYIINGHLMSVLYDDNPSMAASKGLLALQLEGRGDIKAEFRNLWLKHLP